MDDQLQLAYQRLLNYDLDCTGGSFPLSRKLAKEQGWTPDYTHRVIFEYKRFVFLAIHAGQMASPSDAVDQVWHLHLTYTREYWEHFCPAILGTSLHHQPSKGGSVEHAKYRDLYNKTLHAYRVYFDMDAPADIWPRHSSAMFRRIDIANTWIIKRPSWLPQASIAAWAFKLKGVYSELTALLQWKVKHFLQNNKNRRI